MMREDFAEALKTARRKKNLIMRDAAESAGIALPEDESDDLQNDGET